MSTMKALTLWQPWASLCVIENPATGRPFKGIETRGWAAPKSVVGQRIAIHAAVKKPAEGLDVGRFTVERWRYEPTRPCLIGGGGWSTPGSVVNPIDLPLGAVVGTAVVAACLPMVDHFEWATMPPGVILVDDNPEWWGKGDNEAHMLIDLAHEEPFGYYEHGRFGWVLSDVERFTNPIPATGKQGLWNWEPACG